MTDYTELKRLAEAAQYENNETNRDLRKTTAAFFAWCIPEQILELIAENERLSAQVRLAGVAAEVTVHQEVGRALTETIAVAAERDQLKSKNGKLKADNESARMRIKELDLLFGRYLLGMRSAVIEMNHGKGAEAAMSWIVNGLTGPGQLPPEDETHAQAYFDREIVAVDSGMEEVMAFHEARRLAFIRGETI